MSVCTVTGPRFIFMQPQSVLYASPTLTEPPSVYFAIKRYRRPRAPPPRGSLVYLCFHTPGAHPARRRCAAVRSGATRAYGREKGDRGSSHSSGQHENPTHTIPFAQSVPTAHECMHPVATRETRAPACAREATGPVRITVRLSLEASRRSARRRVPERTGIPACRYFFNLT